MDKLYYYIKVCMNMLDYQHIPTLVFKTLFKSFQSLLRRTPIVMKHVLSQDVCKECLKLFYKNRYFFVRLTCASV